MEGIFENSIEFLSLDSNGFDKGASDNFIGLLKIPAEEGHLGYDPKHVCHEIDYIEQGLKANIFGGKLLNSDIHFTGGSCLLEEVIVSPNALFIEPLV